MPPEHETVVDHLARWSFRNVDDSSVLIRVQQSLGLSNADSVPQPDLVWVVNADYSHARPTAVDVLLLVEVAQSSVAYDLGEKADLYAASGIAEYWVVDCTNHCVVAHRDPDKSGYRFVPTYRHGESLSPMSRPQAVLLPSVLFQPETR